MSNKSSSRETVNTSRRSFLQKLSLGTTGLAAGGFYHPKEALPLFGSSKSEVQFRTGTDRREMVYQSLKPFQNEVEKAIGDRQVIIKANAGLAKPEFAMYSTHADHLRGILDFLKPIYDRQIIITEGTAGTKVSAFIGFENYGLLPLEKEYNVKLVDANLTPYTLQWIRAAKHHPQAINIIDMFTDPDVFLISAAKMKTHNAVVGTYSLKNVVMGAPVSHWNKKGSAQVNEKSKMHGGPGSSGGRELSYNMFLVAKMGVQPDLSVIDGVDAIEGNGPWGGEIVEHGVVVTSTDFVAADRLCTDLMGIDPKYMKYLEWCSEAGMGNFDHSNIRVKGPDWKEKVITYKLNKNIDWQIEWIHENFEATSG
ncbi:DUF362 domain-containing protein [Candidatus Latescibacterota bacterium]